MAKKQQVLQGLDKHKVYEAIQNFFKANKLPENFNPWDFLDIFDSIKEADIDKLFLLAKKMQRMICNDHNSLLTKYYQPLFLKIDRAYVKGNRKEFLIALQSLCNAIKWQ